MKRRKLLPAGLAFLAILGLFAGAGLPPEAISARAAGSTDLAWRAVPGSEFVATPIPAASVTAVQLPPLQPCLTDVQVVAPRHDWERGLHSEDPSGGDLHAVLVSAQILAQYSPFRESLTSP
jgi:hypothetical protein